jgi:hypothetical protein
MDLGWRLEKEHRSCTKIEEGAQIDDSITRVKPPLTHLAAGEATGGRARRSMISGGLLWRREEKVPEEV